MSESRASCTILIWLLVSAAMAASPNPAAGQVGRDERSTPSKTAFRFSYTPIYQFETDLDSGGNFTFSAIFSVSMPPVLSIVNGCRGLGLGGDFRSYRFRLDDSSTVADGIGQVDFWALFLRTGYQFGQHLSVDNKGGTLLNGSITIENKNADELGDTDFDPAPFIGATIRGRF